MDDGEGSPSMSRSSHCRLPPSMQHLKPQPATEREKSIGREERKGDRRREVRGEERREDAGKGRQHLASCCWVKGDEMRRLQRRGPGPFLLSSFLQCKERQCGEGVQSCRARHLLHSQTYTEWWFSSQHYTAGRI